MKNSYQFTKEEVDFLREYLNLTLPVFRETVDKYEEDSAEHIELGSLYQRISSLSFKLDSL